MDSDIDELRMTNKMDLTCIGVFGLDFIWIYFTLLWTV